MCDDPEYGETECLSYSTFGGKVWHMEHDYDDIECRHCGAEAPPESE